MSFRDPQPTGVPARHRGGRSLNSLAVQLSAFALTFILVAFLVVTSSRAAFTAQSNNLTNHVSAGAITLTDNDLGVSMFNTSGLVPLQVVDKCIDVTYTGTVDPAPVSLYIAGAPTGSLGSYLNLTIDYGPDTADPYGSCSTFTSSPTSVYSGTLAGFAAARATYAAGTTAWDPAGSETRTFRFRISVQDDPAAAGLTSDFGFTWEIRTS